jgi:uncharacterized protein (TIGR01777 family)
MPAPADALFAWHARPGAFERLAPPWEVVEVRARQGEGLAVGTRVTVRTRVGPLPATLVAEHTRLEPGRLFEDRQLRGPFRSWVHTHTMEPDGPAASVLEDRVAYGLPLGALGRGVAGGMVRRRLARMFAWRHAVTASDLRRHAAWGPGRPLKVVVAGASGLVGRALVPFLTTGGHAVVRLVRGRTAGPGEARWDPAAGALDPGVLEGADAVVNLAGAGIGEGRWSPARKEALLQSRVQSTALLARTLAGLAGRGGRAPAVWVNASAVGFYGDRGGEPLSEASAPGDDFLARVCRAWEAATRPAEDAGVRVVHLRTGLVVSGHGGALGRMLPAFRAGAGGRIGPGTQWVSWVSLEDVLGALLLALSRAALVGPVNLVAPGAVTQGDFARTLGRVLRRPALTPLPAPAVRALFGEMGEGLLLAGQRVAPERLLSAGFRFEHPDLEAALRALLGRPAPSES